MASENSDAIERATDTPLISGQCSFGADGWIREDEVDTLAKSIAYQVQEILLSGFDSISHADLAARIDALLDAMPSGRPLVIALQGHLFDGDFVAAMHRALDLVDREHALMAAARAQEASRA
ncbi:hypothetical protein [Phreatobacter sp.]|uniref:hypothetical protein n=1 Tax=Phreatobacter sp. TaxID=1966341 RepID=UPI003F7001D2